MSTIKVDVSSSKKPVLQVGYQEENEVTDVLFDISAWVEEYGGGTAGLRVKRPQNSEEESYELSLPISENVATWTVSETDTYNKGNGKVQLKYYVGSALKESAVYTYKVGKSIVGSDDPVDPFDTWIERSKAWATGELLDGEDVPASDETYHNNSKYYSEQVEGQAAEAKTQADLAKEYAHQFVGAPRAASTAGGMTDHDLIYVFTGTTTSSLTNGHWYYWNGSAWTDGGVYNSTAFTTDTTLSVSGAAADAKVVGDLKEDLGAFKYSQNKKARLMTVNQSCSTGDVFYFNALKWSGDSWTQIAVQGMYNGAYTTLLRATSLNQELSFVADKNYTSFVVSINVSAVPSVDTEFEFILCNISNLNNISSYVFENRINSFKYRGYLEATANINNITADGWHLIASSRIPTMTGLPADLSTDAILFVYKGSLTVQIIRELSYPYNTFQRYLYGNNTNQSIWIKIPNYYRAKTAYLFGDSLTKGVLGTSGTGTSYLELALKKVGYSVVNCGVGGIGYVYSSKKLVSEVPWNTGEGRIRAQDVIEHYASELVNADTVVLAYGVNDWQTLGDTGVTIAEADRRATSENLTANVKTAIETIMTANIGARIIVVTPINTSYRGGSVSSGWGLETSLNNNNDGREAMTLEKTYQAIVDACDYYGVEYIDMTHNNATVNYLNINNVLPDHLHPSQTTYNRLADSIIF